MTGWTQTPNFIYDLMPTMKEAEMKVVMAVVRQTIGWQVERVTLRMADMQDLTGLSHPSVNTGIKAAMERGVLGREVDGDTFCYWLIEPCESDARVKIFNSEAVNDSQELSPQSKNSLPSDVKNINSDTVKNLNTNKRNIYTNKIKEKAEEIAADAAPPLPPVVPAKPKRSRKSQTPPSTSGAPPPREPTEWQEFVGAFCWLCHGHMEVATLTKEQKGALLAEGKMIHEQAFTVKDLKQWYKTVWGQSWQYKKNKTARPLPSEVRSSIAQLRAETPEGFEVVIARNGNHVNGSSKIASNLAALDDYDQIKLRHGVTT